MLNNSGSKFCLFSFWAPVKMKWSYIQSPKQLLIDNSRMILQTLLKFRPWLCGLSLVLANNCCIAHASLHRSNDRAARKIENCRPGSVGYLALEWWMWEVCSEQILGRHPLREHYAIMTLHLGNWNGIQGDLISDNDIWNSTNRFEIWLF